MVILGWCFMVLKLICMLVEEAAGVLCVEYTHLVHAVKIRIWN